VKEGRRATLFGQGRSLIVDACAAEFREQAIGLMLLAGAAPRFLLPGTPLFRLFTQLLMRLVSGL